MGFDDDVLCLSVWLAQLVKALATPTHVRLCVSIPRADKLDSGFHPSGFGKMRSN